MEEVFALYLPEDLMRVEPPAPWWVNTGGLGEGGGEDGEGEREGEGEGERERREGERERREREREGERGRGQRERTEREKWEEKGSEVFDSASVTGNIHTELHNSRPDES